MKSCKQNRIQSTQPLWTSLPDAQQELISGGAPKVSGGGSGGNNNSGGSGGASGTSKVTVTIVTTGV